MVYRKFSKSRFLGWLAFVILVSSTIGLIYLYGFIFGLTNSNLDLFEVYNKTWLVIISTVITEVIIFGGLLFYIIRKKKRNATEEALVAPNAYVCPNCNVFKQIKRGDSNKLFFCPNCNTLMKVKHLDHLPNVKPKTGGCWIATAVYGDPFQPEIETLRDFRDSIMDNTKFGHKLTKFYYRTSPPIADFISNYLSLRKFLKLLFIQPSVRISESILKLKQKNYSQDLKTIRKILRNRYFSRYSNHN